VAAAIPHTRISGTIIGAYLMMGSYVTASALWLHWVAANRGPGGSADTLTTPLSVTPLSVTPLSVTLCDRFELRLPSVCQAPEPCTCRHERGVSRDEHGLYLLAASGDPAAPGETDNCQPGCARDCAGWA
jgi:hypothetical protein